MMRYASAMIHSFAAALSQDAQRKRQQLLADAAAFWREAPAALASGGGEALGNLLRQFDPRLSIARVAGKLRIRAMELDAWPSAELVCEAAPSDLPAGAGLPEGDHAQALAVTLARTGIALTDARVRVGVSRGHLLAIVVEVPLDIGADPDRLQLAAETYVEVCLGDALSDEWVLSIDVTRGARQKSMLRVANQDLGADTYPLSEMQGLVARATRAILEGGSRPWTEADGPIWTALHIGEGGALQQDRRHASTCCPEALKSALEGLPFDSRRFTVEQELFFWVSFEAGRTNREALRDLAERIVAGAPGCFLGGMGFGEHHDYLDLWVAADVARLQQLCRDLAGRLGLPLSVGFYDSRLAGEPIAVSPTEG